MTKINKIALLLLVLTICCCICCKSSNEVFAIEDDVEFENFEFETAKIREHGKLKVELSLSWSTEKEIIITAITSKIADIEQIFSNIEYYHQVDNENDKHKHYYQINYTIENWQTGTLELEISYINVDNYEKNDKKFYIPAGRWLKEEVNWTISIFFALLTTACVGIGTLIVIESNKKSYDDSNIDE